MCLLFFSLSKFTKLRARLGSLQCFATGIIPAGPRIDFTAPTRRAVPKLGG
jgi:hypothetical protein